MNKIIEQINQKVNNNIKEKAKSESVEEWYSRGVQENMQFMKWLFDRKD